MKTDILIVGCGVAGLYAALSLPKNKKITIITKSDTESSDSYLAQGGICMLKNEDDYDCFFEDTMKAGHYENNPDSVEIMIRSSADVIKELINYGVDFAKNDNELCFTREGGHSTNRILYHKDITGKEITRKLLSQVKMLENVSILEYTTMVDLLVYNNSCHGAIVRNDKDEVFPVYAVSTILACGGIGGLYDHSTNYPHLTGDGLAVCIKHGIELLHTDYIQIHPTTLYSTKPGRQFLISESVRGEGAFIYNKNGERFVNELLPRDILTAAIYKQMEEDNTQYVMLDMRPIGKETIEKHFPNIYEKCIEEGYDPTKECIPIVPAQHYFMGGIKVDKYSMTSMDGLYAAGETSCNGVHGANRLASNSLLESLVFAKRAALHIVENYNEYEARHINTDFIDDIDTDIYSDMTKWQTECKQLVLEAIEKERQSHE